MSTPFTPITAIAPLPTPVVAPGAVDAQRVGDTSTTSSVNFGDLLDQKVNQISSDLQAAQATMRDYAAGKPVELHEMMIRIEQARLSVQVFMQIRNKVAESYQELMRMQA